MKRKKQKKEEKEGKEIFVVKIRRVTNGLILLVKISQGPNEEMVFQERYEEEVECFADFLRLLNEHFGPSTHRHSEKRIYILVEPGDRFEGRKK